MVNTKRVDRNRREISFLTGFRRFLGFGPKMPVYQKYHQKGGLSEWCGKTPSFLPSDYNADSPQQARRMAYEDARNHAKFYKALVKEGIYPRGTKVKVKRIKQSDGFGIQLFMPEIHAPNNSKYRGYYHVPRGAWDNLYLGIKEIARKFGYAGQFHEDIGLDHNYYEDKDGIVRYIDAEVLFDGKLPFPSRKDVREMSRNRHIRDTRRYKHKKGLEQTLAIVGIMGGLLFLSPNFTGNVIGNITISNSTIIGAVFLIIGLVGGFFWVRSRK